MIVMNYLREQTNFWKESKQNSRAMDDRILVYKQQEGLYNNSGYDQHLRSYQCMKKKLQGLVDGMKNHGIEPTMNLVEKALSGENLRNLIAKNSVSYSLSFLPKQIKNSLENMIEKENEENYQSDIEEKIECIRTHRDKTLTNLSFFEIENGEVLLSPEHIKEAERLYCVFIDTPTREKVYEKYLAFIEAAKQFEEAVKEAPKRDVPEAVRNVREPNFIKAIGGIDTYSLVVLDYNGEFLLHGERFKDIM